MQYRLGHALRRIGERGGGTERLEEAAAAYRLALGVWTREREPDNWAPLQANLGHALRLIGERGDKIERLEEAADALRLALQEWTADRAPGENASTLEALNDVRAEIQRRRSPAGKDTGESS
ncbi:MAG TPA: hypothetical protein VHB23_07280 [Devosiaceae bacterium]|nr:hypothetical protein [Devosiaceae bacterium]